MLITDTGWNSWEEINSGGPGANFGWPFYEGGDGGESPSDRRLSQPARSGGLLCRCCCRRDRHHPGLPRLCPSRQRAGLPGPGHYRSRRPDLIGAISRSAAETTYIFTDVSQGEVFAVNANDRRDVKFLFEVGGAVLRRSISSRARMVRSISPILSPAKDQPAGHLRDWRRARSQPTISISPARSPPASRPDRFFGCARLHRDRVTDQRIGHSGPSIPAGRAMISPRAIPAPSPSRRLAATLSSRLR